MNNTDVHQGATFRCPQWQGVGSGEGGPEGGALALDDIPRSSSVEQERAGGVRSRDERGEGHMRNLALGGSRRQRRTLRSSERLGVRRKTVPTMPFWPTVPKK
jgi:hypothetical protein